MLKKIIIWDTKSFFFPLHFILSVFFSSNKKNKFKNKLIHPIYIFKFEIIYIYIYLSSLIIITDKKYFAAGPEFSRNLYTFFSSIQHVPPLCSGTTSYTLTYVQVHSWILRILELNDLNWFDLINFFYYWKLYLSYLGNKNISFLE